MKFRKLHIRGNNYILFVIFVFLNISCFQCYSQEDKVYDNWSDVFNNQDSVIHLSISTRNIDPDLLKKIHLPNLESLDCFFYPYTKREVEDEKSMFEFIFKCNNLNVLKIREHEGDTLPFQICALTKLKELHCIKTRYKIIPEEIKNLKKLESLNLRNNEIEVLPEGIGYLENLNILDVSKNNISQIPISFEHLKKLKVLDLSSNQIQNLPKEFSGLTALETLQIDHNK